MYLNQGYGFSPKMVMNWTLTWYVFKLIDNPPFFFNRSIEP